jgi:Protein of unknown function (DUF3237)
MPELQTEFLFEIKITLAAPIDIGQTPEGYRPIFMAQSGSFEGPKIKGIVVPMSGGDWFKVRADGSGSLDVRWILKTDDGAPIIMTYFGRLVASPENWEYALDLAKLDDPQGAERYYFRTNPLFETGDARYSWLNHIVAIGKGRTGENGVIYEVFAVK